MMQKMLLRKFRPHHDCEQRMKPISVGTTPRCRDDLVYTYNEQQYRMFKVIKILESEQYVAREFNITGKVFKRHPSLHFDTVGVFNNHGFKTEKTVLDLSQIKGKVFSHGSLLMSIPMNILVER